MLTRTLTNLIADARMWSNLGTSQAVTDTQITKLLNDSIRSLLVRLLSVPGYDYLEKSATQATVAGTKSYDKPADCYEIKYITQPSVTDSRVTVKLQQHALADTEETYTTYPIADAFEYRLIGNKIFLYPTPTGVTTLTLYYVPILPVYNASAVAIAELSTGTDYMDCGLLYDQWVAMDAAAKILVIQELSTADVNKHKDGIWDEIVASVAIKNQYSPGRLPKATSHHELRR